MFWVRNFPRLREAGAVLRRSHVGRADGEQENEPERFAVGKSGPGLGPPAAQNAAPKPAPVPKSMALSTWCLVAPAGRGRPAYVARTPSSSLDRNWQTRGAPESFAAPPYTQGRLGRTSKAVMGVRARNHGSRGPSTVASAQESSRARPRLTAVIVVYCVHET